MKYGTVKIEYVHCVVPIYETPATTFLWTISSSTMTGTIIVLACIIPSTFTVTTSTTTSTTVGTIVIIGIIATFTTTNFFNLTKIHFLQDNRGTRRPFITPRYLSHSLHKQLDISRAITPESPSLHIANDWTRNGVFRFPGASR